MVLPYCTAFRGPTAHKVFLFFCLLTNVIVTSMLILGGASVISALSGVNIYAAAFLIPIGVMFYTAHGGLKATFMASWIHVTIIYIALVVYTFSIYTANKDLGSPGKVWDNLMVMAGVVPVEGNRGGSYVTMLSQQGLVFGVINIIGNFGTVFVDQVLLSQESE
jgi:Na+/proline symporter